MISREADYALRIVLFLAQQEAEGASCTSALLAKELDIPYYFLRLIIKRLIEHKFIISRKGRNGGVSLAKNIGDISLYDIIESIHPTGVVLSKCTDRLLGCDKTKQCALHSVFNNLQQVIDKELRDITFETLIKK